MRTLVMGQENAIVSEKPFRPSLLATLAGAFVALLLCVALAVPAGADDGGEYVSRQVVAKIKAGASIGAIERKFRVTRIERLPGAGKIYLLRTRQGVNPANLARRMELDSSVLYAEPNFRAGIIRRTTQPSADATLQAGHADVEASTKYAPDPARSCLEAGDDD